MTVISLARTDLEGPDGTVRVRPVQVLQVGLLLIFVGNLGHIPFLDLGGRQAPLYLIDICALATLVVGLAAAARTRSLRFDNVALVAVLFAIIGLLSAVGSMARYGLSIFELVASLAYLARWVVYLGLYVVIVNFVRERDIRPVWEALELTMVLFGAFGIFQSAFLPDFGLMLNPDAVLYETVDPQGHRLVSTILEPNIAAAMLMTVLLVQIAQLAFGGEVRRGRLWLLVIAFALTLSRSGAAGFIVGMTLILLARGLGARLLRFVGTGVFLILISLPGLIPFAMKYEKFNVVGGSGIAARMFAWERALATFVEHPWFGIGFNTYGFVQQRQGIPRTGAASYATEGGLLFIAVMTGVVGLAVYCVMLGLVLRRCRWVRLATNALPRDRGLAVGTAAATIAVIVHSVFVNSLTTPFVLFPLWTLWGLVFVTAARLKADSLDGAPARSPLPAPRTAAPAPSCGDAAAARSIASFP
jgi:hypothetical protein